MKNQKTEAYTSRFVSTVQAINERGWSADLGIGAIFALLVGLPAWLWGPGGGVMGVPASMIWGAGAFVAGFFGSLALYPFGSDD